MPANQRARDENTQPAIFLPHGGGPAFFMAGPMGDLFAPMAEFLSALPTELPQRPRAILVVTAHWEAAEISFSGAAHHDLLFDYYGFPAETYSLRYDAAGDPALATTAAGLLSDAGITSRVDSARGWDHGVFIPLKVMFPLGDISVVAMSLKMGLDPDVHHRVGVALQQLRSDNVLIIGSGMSYHNLANFADAATVSQAFDAWLDTALDGNHSHRQSMLSAWTQAPGARSAHPREEHLLPLMVTSGAGSDSPAKKIWAGSVGATSVSAWRFD